MFLVLEYGMEFSNHLVVELQLIRLILKCRRLRVCVKERERERERERDGERGRERERERERGSHHNLGKSLYFIKMSYCP